MSTFIRTLFWGLVLGPGAARRDRSNFERGGRGTNVAPTGWHWLCQCLPQVLALHLSSCQVLGFQASVSQPRHWHSQ